MLRPGLAKDGFYARLAVSQYFPTFRNITTQSEYLCVAEFTVHLPTFDVSKSELFYFNYK